EQQRDGVVVQAVGRRHAVRGRCRGCRMAARHARAQLLFPPTGSRSSRFFWRRARRRRGTIGIMRAPLPFVLAAILAGCGPATDGAPDDAGALHLPLDPVTLFVGELHLHQFPAGGHAWAAFVGAPLPVADVHSDQLFSLETAVTASEGTCRLWRRPICDGGCPGGSYCAG